MAHASLVSKLREDGTAKNMAAVMKEIVSAMNATDETRRKLREKIDAACGSKKTREHAKAIDNFNFKAPTQTLGKWKTALRTKNIDPSKQVHFNMEYGVNYVNTNASSWTENEDSETWRVVDRARKEWDARELGKSRKQGAGAEPYEPNKMPTEDQRRMYEEVKKESQDPK
jgi:hypothetical protein